MKTVLYEINRFYNWVYAGLFGYFWKPCPICNEMFGGHEEHGFLHTNVNTGVTVCKNCKEEAVRRNKERGFHKEKGIYLEL